MPKGCITASVVIMATMAITTWAAPNYDPLSVDNTSREQTGGTNVSRRALLYNQHNRYKGFEMVITNASQVVKITTNGVAITGGGNVTIDGNQVSTNSYAYAEGYSSNASVTLTLQNTFYPWTNWVMGDYTADRIGWRDKGVYVSNAKGAGKYIIVGSMSISVNAPTEEIHAHLFKSSSPYTTTNEVEGIGGSVDIVRSGISYTIPVNGIVDLDLNDYLEVRFANFDSAGKVVTSTHLNFMMHWIGP